jgi:hypothetical protein
MTMITNSSSVPVQHNLQVGFEQFGVGVILRVADAVGHDQVWLKVKRLFDVDLPAAADLDEFAGFDLLAHIGIVDVQETINTDQCIEHAKFAEMRQLRGIL